VTATVVQLRQLLREKFPGLTTRADELSVHRPDGWPTGIIKLDDRIGGGCPRSAMSEIIVPRAGCGSALLLLQLLRRAASQNQFTALIDGRDSFDAASVEQTSLDHLIWIRCHKAEEAIKATDLVLRDGNLQLVLLDLVLNPAAELRKIPAPTWYRFQRVLEESTAAFIAFTPFAMLSLAEVRVTLRSHFGLWAVEADPVKLTMELDFDVTDARDVRTEEPLRKIA
jgi:hypothetical protein